MNFLGTKYAMHCKNTFENILRLPTVPSPRPAYFIHQGTSSLATGSCPGFCIIDDSFSANDYEGEKIVAVRNIRHVLGQFEIHGFKMSLPFWSFFDSLLYQLTGPNGTDSTAKHCENLLMYGKSTCQHLRVS